MALARLLVLTSPAYLDIDTGEYDEPLKTLLQVASKFAETYTGRVLERASNTADRVEYYNGTDERKLYLEEYPVAEIVEVAIWDGDQWEVIDSTHYELRGERTLVYPLRTKADDAEHSCWPSTFDEGIRITFKAGYLTDEWAILNPWADFPVPPDLEDAICELAMKDWIDSKGGQSRFMMSSISRGVESIQVDKFVQGIPEAAKHALDRYTDHHV